MASHATHIRRIYSRPWRNGSLANPGKIPTGIQVSVRPETTGRALRPERRRGASGAADTPTRAWLWRTCATSRFHAASVSGNVFVEQVERSPGIADLMDSPTRLGQDC